METRKIEVRGQKSEVGKSPFVFPLFQKGENRGIIKIKNGNWWKSEKAGRWKRVLLVRIKN